MDGPDDWTLLQAWRAGDTKAGETLFERHFLSVSRFWRSKLPSQAEDRIQGTFLATVEGKDRIRTEGSFKGYLFGIARRQLFRHLRDQHRDPELDFMSRSIADLGPGLPTNLGRKREHRVMIEALRNLPLDLQLVLELYYWEELPAPAVAEALEIPEGTVRSRVRRAREALASAWGELQRTQLPPTEADLEQWARRVRELIDAGD